MGTLNGLWGYLLRILQGYAQETLTCMGLLKDSMKGVVTTDSADRPKWALLPGQPKLSTGGFRVQSLPGTPQ